MEHLAFLEQLLRDASDNPRWMEMNVRGFQGPVQCRPLRVDADSQQLLCFVLQEGSFRLALSDITHVEGVAVNELDWQAEAERIIAALDGVHTPSDFLSL